MAYIGNQPTVGNFVKLDAIVTSATATYNLLNGGVAYTPASVLNMIVSLNGVIQEPTTSSNVGGFTVSGSTIVFTSALTSADVIDFILVLGDVLNIGTPSDATVTFPKVTSNLITGATAETTIAGGDSVLIYDDSASALRKMTRTNFVAGIGNTPLVQANLAAGDQSITSATYTKVAFDTETIDTGSIYNTGTYTATIATAGKYFVSTYARFSALNSGSSEFGVLQITNSDRSTIYAVTVQSAFTGSGYGFHSLACSALISLSASDTLSVYVYGTEAIEVADDNAGFTIFKVIE